MGGMVRIEAAVTERDLELVEVLFREYARWLDYPVCYENIEREISELPGAYAPPGGALLIAFVGGNEEKASSGGAKLVKHGLAGCCGLRAWSAEGCCEMKRLFVRSAFRGLGIGKSLAELVIEEARRLGYRRMLLDTIPERMREAISLYISIGFRRIEKYRPSPTDTAHCYELTL